jgi:hypothetical protein
MTLKMFKQSFFGYLLESTREIWQFLKIFVEIWSLGNPKKPQTLSHFAKKRKANSLNLARKKIRWVTFVIVFS